MSKPEIPQTSAPTHVAIIMDGNRRWAAKRGLGAVDGHRVAAEKTIKPIVEHAIKRGIGTLTFWAFSTENRKRDTVELKGLFTILQDALRTNLQELADLGVQIKIIGNIDWFPGDIASLARKIVEKTRDNKKITVSFALNYGGRDELLRAVSRLLDKIQTHQRSADEPITEEEFSGYMDTAGIPDPDLIIRTGGEKRLSGYFPWQAVYAELYFTKTLWPDFSPAKFERALCDFAKRNRRFGVGKFVDYIKSAAKKVAAPAFVVDIGTQYRSPVQNITDVGSLVSRVVGNLYLVAGILLFILFMWGGFEYIRGAGSDDRDAIGRGKKIIVSAITGFLIIFASYWIIQLIELLANIKIF